MTPISVTSFPWRQAQRSNGNCSTAANSVTEQWLRSCLRCDDDLILVTGFNAVLLKEVFEDRSLSILLRHWHVPNPSQSQHKQAYQS